MAFNPEYQRYLGTNFVAALTRRAVFTIGREAYSKHRIVTELGTGNFRAARIVEAAMKEHGVTSIDQLKRLPPEQLAATKGLGVTSLYFILCLLDAKGADTAKYYLHGQAEAVTFDSLKARKAKELGEATRERKSAKKRQQNARTRGLKQTADQILGGATP